jgi:hypothetical protein
MIAKDETIHIVWAHHGEIDNGFAISLLDLVTKSGRNLTYNSMRGLGLLAKTRNMLVKTFLDDTTADWLFMVDGDEFASLDSFEKLARAADAEKVPIISGLCFGNKSPVDLEPSPCIFIFNETKTFTPYYEYPEDKVVPIAAAGAGCLMIHRSVLEAVRKQEEEISGKDWAWFQDGPAGHNTWLSEDLMFSLRVVAAGYQMYAHTGAVFPHHKDVWLTDKHYKQFMASPAS